MHTNTNVCCWYLIRIIKFNYIFVIITYLHFDIIIIVIMAQIATIIYLNINKYLNYLLFNTKFSIQYIIIPIHTCKENKRKTIMNELKWNENIVVVLLFNKLISFLLTIRVQTIKLNDANGEK